MIALVLAVFGWLFRVRGNAMFNEAEATTGNLADARAQLADAKRDLACHWFGLQVDLWNERGLTVVDVALAQQAFRQDVTA